METTELLREVPFLARLNPEDLRTLAAALRRRRYRRNEVIFHQDDPGDSLFVLVSGTVKIALRSEDGREAILTLLGPGDYFGELALLDGERRSANAIAVEPVEAVSLPRNAFLDALRSNPDAAITLLAAISKEYVRRLTDTVHDAVFLDVPARLASALVRLLEQGRASQEGNNLLIQLTQSDLASMVGATRESINKWLGYYERQGWVKRDRGFISILNEEALLSQEQR